MQYLFNQAVFIAGKSFKPGVHEVPEKVENDPHFLKFVGAGFILDVDATKVVSPLTHKERSEALLNKLHAQKKISRDVAAKALAPSNHEAPVKPVEEEGFLDPAPSKHSKHKKEK